jgi:hypothetical protein
MVSGVSGWVARGAGVVLLACGLLSQRPAAVTGRFWTALQSGDLEAAQALSTARDTHSLELLVEDLEIETLSTGEVLKSERTARVQTSILLKGQTVPLSFETHLTAHEGSWRVVVPETLQAMTRASFVAALAQVEGAVQEGGRLLGEVIEEGAQEASAALREALKEMEKALE